LPGWLLILQPILRGHLRPDLYGHIPKYIERFGVEDGTRLAEFEMVHVQAIKKPIREERIDCDFSLTRTCDVWPNQAAADKAKAVYETMMPHGMDYMNNVHFTVGATAEGICLKRPGMEAVLTVLRFLWSRCNRMYDLRHDHDMAI
jgi:hypothetical protein